MNANNTILKLSWSHWFPLKDSGRNKEISTEAGIYRIRRLEQANLDYVGQTGNSVGLRSRLGMLRGVYGRLMPYNDPHTLGPALWALKQLEQSDYEASVAPLPTASTPLRKGLECVVIAQHRQIHGYSPSFNFGRMPVGYSKSTQNNRKLVAKGKRQRGAATKEQLPCHVEGIGPTGSLGGLISGESLLGLSWTEWMSAIDVIDMLSGDVVGLYRLRRKSMGQLLYVGQGKVRERVKVHVKKSEKPEHPQARTFSDPQYIELSYVSRSDLAEHQRLEIENDLIAAHVLGMGTAPAAQFLG